MRSGMVIFNEVHQFENYNNIKVFITGQGKVAQPRVGIFTSNGEVNDGPLDDYLARGRRILFENEPDNGFLPFICCLETREQVHESGKLVHGKSIPCFICQICFRRTADEYGTGWTPGAKRRFSDKANGLAGRISGDQRDGL